MLRSWKAIVLTAAVAGFFAAAPARAGLLPISVTQTPDNGNTRWTYGIMLTTDNFIKSGDYFTVIDFGGFVPGSATMPSGWTLTTAGVGSSPLKVNPTDDPSITDLTFKYNGPQIDGQVGLGNFTAISTFSNTKVEDFVATSHRQSDGHVDSNITDTQVPVGSGNGPPPGVPEPATLLMVGIGLPLVGGARLLRRKK